VLWHCSSLTCYAVKTWLITFFQLGQSKKPDVTLGELRWCRILFVSGTCLKKNLCVAVTLNKSNYAQFSVSNSLKPDKNTLIVQPHASELVIRDYKPFLLVSQRPKSLFWGGFHKKNYKLLVSNDNLSMLFPWHSFVTAQNFYDLCVLMENTQNVSFFQDCTNGPHTMNALETALLSSAQIAL